VSLVTVLHAGFLIETRPLAVTLGGKGQPRPALSRDLRHANSRDLRKVGPATRPAMLIRVFKLSKESFIGRFPTGELPQPVPRPPHQRVLLGQLREGGSTPHSSPGTESRSRLKLRHPSAPLLCLIVIVLFQEDAK
jgi:hypothetical protein